jgi:chromate transporter
VEGLIVAGFCFIVPGTNNRIFAWLYKDYGQLPAILFLYGIKPAIIAIILGAIFPLAKSLKVDYRWYCFASCAVAVQ